MYTGSLLSTSTACTSYMGGGVEGVMVAVVGVGSEIVCPIPSGKSLWLC